MKITVIVDGAPLIKKTDANKMLKREYRNRGNTWWKKYRLPHFSTVAYSRYGYQKRKPKYNQIKRRRFGHTNPLEFTGTSKQLSNQKRIIATRRSVRIVMGIRVFNFRSKLSKIDKRKEMTTPAEFENKALDKQNQKGLERRITRYRRKTVVV